MNLYTDEMFQQNNLDTYPYLISPTDVHLYEDVLQININVFFFFHDEGRARYPQVISCKNYERVANFLY